MNAAETKPRRFLAFLGIISLASTILYIVFGSSQFIEYDGYWDVFVAQLDNWPIFFRDLYALAHPPLYILLLKASLVFGHSLLVYRSVTILSGAGTVFLMGWITRKITGSEARGYQAALAFGFSMPAILIACEVRAYMLSVLFVLLSFSALLDIGRTEDSQAEFRARRNFVIWTILACLSEYVAFFYAGAALLVLAFRLRGNRQRWRAEALTALPILISIAALYVYATAHFTQVQGYLAEFYRDPAKESIPAFILRNSRNLLNDFLPAKLSLAASEWIWGAAILAAIATALFMRKRNVRWTLFITAASLAAIAAAGSAGKYPYGGFMRQQFQLYPFFILALAAIVEFAATKLRAVAPRSAGPIANAAIAILAVAVGVVEYRGYPKISVNVLAPEVAAFEQMAPAPPAVYVDQWNLITFFIYHHNWRWTFETNPLPGFERYNVEKDGRKIVVFRDLTRWDADPDDDSVYPQFAALLKSSGVESLSTFTIRQSQSKAAFSNLRAVQAEVLTRAPAAGICADKLSVNSFWWYVTLKSSGCRALELPDEPHPAAGTSIISKFADDSDRAISYVGDWGHAKFPQARNQTVSFSKDPGAIARAIFEGNRITWIYTPAFNRGVAEVKIDGVSRGKIDLYSPTIIWQWKRTFEAATPGKHTFELFVTGDKNPKASDRFVDIDALTVE